MDFWSSIAFLSSAAILWVGQVFLIGLILFFNRPLDTKFTHNYNKSKPCFFAPQSVSKWGATQRLINNKSFLHGVRNYSTDYPYSSGESNNSKLVKLDPDYVSGFIDAEASFSTVVYYKNRWCVNSVYLFIKEI